MDGCYTRMKSKQLPTTHKKRMNPSLPTAQLKVDGDLYCFLKSLSEICICTVSGCDEVI